MTGRSSWLKDKDGTVIVPKTLASQSFFDDESTVAEHIGELENDIGNYRDIIVNIESTEKNINSLGEYMIEVGAWDEEHKTSTNYFRLKKEYAIKAPFEIYNTTGDNMYIYPADNVGEYDVISDNSGRTFSDERMYLFHCGGGDIDYAEMFADRSMKQFVSSLVRVVRKSMQDSGEINRINNSLNVLYDNVVIDSNLENGEWYNPSDNANFKRLKENVLSTSNTYICTSRKDGLSISAYDWTSGSRGSAKTVKNGTITLESGKLWKIYFEDDNGSVSLSDILQYCTIISDKSEIGKINESLNAQGLLKKDIKFIQGYHNLTTGIFEEDVNIVTTSDIKNCSNISTITCKSQNGVSSICFYDENKNFISSVDTVTTTKVPNNAKYYHVNVYRYGGLTPDEEKNFILYENNTIEQVKNDLSTKAKYEIANGFIFFRDSLNESNYIAINPEANVMKVSVGGIINNYGLQTL